MADRSLLLFKKYGENPEYPSQPGKKFQQKMKFIKCYTKEKLFLKIHGY